MQALIENIIIVGRVLIQIIFRRIENKLVSQITRVGLTSIFAHFGGKTNYPKGEDLCEVSILRTFNENR